MNFTLRLWQPEDATAIVPHANNPAVVGNLRDVFPYPYTLPDAEGYVQSCIANEGRNQLCRAIVAGGKAVGSIGIFRRDDVYRKSAELGYWLGQAYWRQGIMSGAVMVLCQEAFQTWDIVRIYAEPFANNAGSRSVLEKRAFLWKAFCERASIKTGSCWIPAFTQN